MRYGLSTVPVTSRNAYNLRSAGAISRSGRSWNIRCLENAMEFGQPSDLRESGMDSSLSSVPPVCPIRGRRYGHEEPPAATSGAARARSCSPPLVNLRSPFFEEAEAEIENFRRNAAWRA